MHPVQAPMTNHCERLRRVLRQPSQIVQTTLPRPLGIIFEEDAHQKRAFISGFMDGSPAAQLAQVRWGAYACCHCRFLLTGCVGFTIPPRLVAPGSGPGRASRHPNQIVCWLRNY